MDATSFITNISGAGGAGSTGIFPSLNQHGHLVANGGTLGEFVLKERDVTRRKNDRSNRFSVGYFSCISNFWGGLLLR